MLTSLLVLLLAQAPTPTSNTSDQIPWIWGGADHRTLLGCFCPVDSGRLDGGLLNGSSILNPNSPFGERTAGVFRSGRVGSLYVSDYTACNPTATDSAPEIRDQFGNPLGVLTMNESNPARTQDPTILAWLTRYCAARH